MSDSPGPAPSVANELVSALRAPDAPRDLRLFAARGLLPLERADRIRALLTVLSDADELVSAAAKVTLQAMPLDDLSEFLDEGEPTERELEIVSLHTEDPFVLERVIRSRMASDETLRRLAGIVTGAPQDALIVNQARLLRSPDLIDALLGNPSLTIDGRRRLLELREEFFEKEKRRKEQERLRQEAEEQRLRDEAAGLVAGEAEEDLGPTGSTESEETFKSVGMGEIYKRIAIMTVKEKVALAQKGTKEERRILITDMNRMVSLAVLHCEAITMAELEQICAVRHLAVELYQEIANTREWIKKPKIQLVLVNNPAVPLNITLPMVKFLGLRDLRKITLDRNLPEAIRTTARKVLHEKRG